MSFHHPGPFLWKPTTPISSPPNLPCLGIIPWTGKSCFSNRALIKGKFRGSEMPLKSCFWGLKKWSRLTPYYYSTITVVKVMHVKLCVRMVRRECACRCHALEEAVEALQVLQFNLMQGDVAWRGFRSRAAGTQWEHLPPPDWRPRVIPWKSPSFPKIWGVQNRLKITKNNSQGITFVPISCQRVGGGCKFFFFVGLRLLAFVCVFAWDPEHSQTVICKTVFREFLDKGCSESLCKEQSQITLFKSPLIRPRTFANRNLQTVLREFLDMEKGWPELLCKEQSQITLCKSPLIRSWGKVFLRCCLPQFLALRMVLCYWKIFVVPKWSRKRRNQYT